jgi:hypothetical protein
MNFHSERMRVTAHREAHAERRRDGSARDLQDVAMVAAYRTGLASAGD